MRHVSRCAHEYIPAGCQHILPLRVPKEVHTLSGGKVIQAFSVILGHLLSRPTLLQCIVDERAE